MTQTMRRKDAKVASAPPDDGPGSALSWVPVVVLVAVGLVVWGFALQNLDIRRTTDLGLVSVVPAWIAFGPLAVLGAFLWTLRLPAASPFRRIFLVLTTVSIIVILFGTGPLIEPLTPNHVAWRHVGIADEVLRNGIDTSIDAYFSWPGFFGLTALAVDVAGPFELVRIVRWAPVVMNGLFLLPVMLIAQQVTVGWRMAWTAAWVFLLGNWVGQDYFAPQALAYLGYLVIIAMLVTAIALPATSNPLRWGGSTPWMRAKLGESRLYALLAVVAVYAWIVMSHQLTPFAILLVVGALVVAQRPVPKSLLLLLLAIQVAWLTFMAADYLRGNLGVLVDQLGNVDQIAQANITDRVGGSSTHRFIVQLRMLTVAGLAGAGFLGWFRAFKSSTSVGRYQHLTVGLAGVAPFALIALAAYGGEVALRAYLFALPILAIYTATLFTRSSESTDARQIDLGRRQLWLPGAAFILIVMLALFPFTKYGNDDTLYFTEYELATIEAMYGAAPPGSTLVSATANLPWKWKAYSDYEYRTLMAFTPFPALGELDDRLRDLLEDGSESGFIVLTRSQGAYNDAFGVWPSGGVESLAETLRGADDFVVIYESIDGVVFKYVG